MSRKPKRKPARPRRPRAKQQAALGSARPVPHEQPHALHLPARYVVRP